MSVRWSVRAHNITFPIIEFRMEQSSLFKCRQIEKQNLTGNHTRHWLWANNMTCRKFINGSKQPWGFFLSWNNDIIKNNDINFFSYNNLCILLFFIIIKKHNLIWPAYRSHGLSRGCEHIPSSNPHIIIFSPREDGPFHSSWSIDLANWIGPPTIISSILLFPPITYPMKKEVWDPTAFQ